MPYSLTWLPDVLRTAGLKVVEQAHWQSRGHGDVGVIKGVIAHHTAGPRGGNSPSLGIVTSGRPDLAGPLAHLVLARDGTFIVVAAGKCWHAGAGLWQGVHDGNSQMIGIEAENTGLVNDCPWPEVQMSAYARGVAAILEHIKAPPIMCAGHLEWATPIGRKSDPSFSAGTREQRIAAMVAFRKSVAIIMGLWEPHPEAHVQTKADDTKWLQHSLNALGAKPALKEDGAFGPMTNRAVVAYQRVLHVDPTGVVDEALRMKIREDLGHHEGCSCS